MADYANTNRKRRGRPPGSGADDTATLIAMADLLAAEPDLKPTTAMKRAVRKIGASQLRRLQVKWKKDGAALPAAAQQRRKQCPVRQDKSRRILTTASSNYAAMAGALGPSFHEGAAMASPSLGEQARQLAISTHDYLGVRMLERVNPQLGIDQQTLHAITGGLLLPALQAAAALAEPEWMKHIRKITEPEEELRRLFNPLGRFGM